MSSSIRFKAGDVLREPAEALVNTVNCIGVMGRGIALQFKKAFPRNYQEYKAACDRGQVVPGRMFVTHNHGLDGPRLIINFPTKRHWRGRSRMEDMESGLEALRNEIALHSIRSIAIPPLGSGLGGLDWLEVRKRIEAALADVEADVIVFEPDGPPDPDVMARTAEAPPMTPGRATVVALVDRYLEGLLDPFVTLLEIHKLTYFMQEAGEPLDLSYKKGPYGPYAENIRHVLNAIEGHYVSGYADGGDQPGKELAHVPGAATEASVVIKQRPNTCKRIERVDGLIEGFETPYGLELLASVHWLVKYEGNENEDELLGALRAWNPRKGRFTNRQVRIAYDRLLEQGWTSVPN